MTYSLRHPLDAQSQRVRRRPHRHSVRKNRGRWSERDRVSPNQEAQKGQKSWSDSAGVSVKVFQFSCFRPFDFYESMPPRVPRTSRGVRWCPRTPTAIAPTLRSRCDHSLGLDAWSESWLMYGAHKSGCMCHFNRPSNQRAFGWCWVYFPNFPGGRCLGGLPIWYTPAVLVFLAPEDDVARLAREVNQVFVTKEARGARVKLFDVSRSMCWLSASLFDPVPTLGHHWREGFERADYPDSSVHHFHDPVSFPLARLFSSLLGHSLPPFRRWPGNSLPVQDGKPSRDLCWEHGEHLDGPFLAGAGTPWRHATILSGRKEGDVKATRAVRVM